MITDIRDEPKVYTRLPAKTGVKTILGDNYDGTVYQGDTFNGPISNGIVGGRHNTNTYTVKNHGSSSDDDVQKAISDAEERKRLAIQKLEALKKKKEEREKLRRIEEEARQLEEQAKQIEAELEEDSQTSG